MALDASNRRNLVTRIVTALVLLPSAVWLTWLGGTAFAVLAAVAAAIMAGELILMFGLRGAPVGLGAAVAGAFPIATLLAPHGQLFPGWFPLAIAFATIAVMVLFLFRDAPLEEIPRGMAIVALSWLYCGLLLTPVAGLRDHLAHGFGWVVLAFLATWGNDTFAYFAGHLFGKHKLAPRISPKKTWEGFFGGVLGSLVGVSLVWWFLLGDQLGFGDVAALAAGASVFGPLGDLCESLLKRAAGVKDSSQIVPGHGGLLDRVDALLFVGPWVYLYAVYLR
ncbi:MAG: phosphatidate cytidylyltransferase [Anaeromyxobacter sp.]